MYSYSSEITMSQAAFLLLDAEAALFNGQYRSIICDILNEKGLLKECEIVSSIHESFPNQLNADISLGWKEPFLTISSTSKIERVYIYDLEGRLLSNSIVNNFNTQIKLTDKSKMVLVKVLHSNGFSKTIKQTLF